MPLIDPITSTDHTYYLSQAQMRLFGESVESTDPDGWVGFNSESNATWDYNPNDGITDFQDTVKHESSEVMGWFFLVGFQLQPGTLAYSLYDLFHYSAANTRLFAVQQMVILVSMVEIHMN